MGKKYTKKSFIEAANKKHNNKYDYSLVDWVNVNGKVKILCKEHGVFEQTGASHLAGRNCYKCSLIKRGKIRRSSKETFINKANETHNNKYDYSLVNYTGNKIAVDIICKIHGCFKQRPDCHLFLKQGCPKCGGTARLSLKEFIKRATDRHDGFFDYSLVKFNNITDSVYIICPKHGVFNQNVKAHYDGNGCPKCNTSKLEKRVLKELKNILTNNEIIQFYKSEWLGRQHIDIFLPSFNIGIECNGIQHYEPIEKFGGEKAFKRGIELDIKKRKLCLDNNVFLYEIPYFYTKKELLEIIEKIKNKING